MAKKVMVFFLAFGIAASVSYLSMFIAPEIVWAI